MYENLQKVTVLCENVTTASSSLTKRLDGFDVNRTFQATVTGTGVVSATVYIEVSNDGVGWLYDTVSTLTLSGTNVASDGFASTANWTFVRARIGSISGTNAAVTATVGG